MYVLFASYVYIKTVFLSALNLDFSCISLTNYYYKILFILMRSHLQTLVFRVLFNRKSFFSYIGYENKMCMGQLGVCIEIDQRMNEKKPGIT